eukprot:4196729-Lingulodinium_polyedra.AAC.1
MPPNQGRGLECPGQRCTTRPGTCVLRRTPCVPPERSRGTVGTRSKGRPPRRAVRASNVPAPCRRTRAGTGCRPWRPSGPWAPTGRR